MRVQWFPPIFTETKNLQAGVLPQGLTFQVSFLQAHPSLSPALLDTSFPETSLSMNMSLIIIAWWSPKNSMYTLTYICHAKCQEWLGTLNPPCTHVSSSVTVSAESSWDTICPFSPQVLPQEKWEPCSKVPNTELDNGCIIHTFPFD